MAKPINIQSLVQAKASLDKDTFESYARYFGFDIKDSELRDLNKFASATAGGGGTLKSFEKFYVGYKIPQIGKEFDLLRFGKKSIVNIEIKRTSSVENIRKQLQRNSYYLGFAGLKLYTFAFVSGTQELYALKADGGLEHSDIESLVEILDRQMVSDSGSPDSLFDPSQYLVSPFNSTKRFLAGEYFLTHQQEEVKSKTLGSLEKAKAVCPSFIAITGSAGTGKTLLTYDIVRQLMKEGKRALILHCGQLNDGHALLANHGWEISPIKAHKARELADFDLVVIDEAQRIYDDQLDDIVARVKLAKIGCVFSYDKVQTLSTWEAKNNAAGKIEGIASIESHKLSEKIRTNKEIAVFIKMLLNMKKNLPLQNNGNIEINYFNNTDDAKKFLENLDSSHWEVLRFTPSQYYDEHHEKYFERGRKTSHQVIGQEFDAVAIAVDEYFGYDASGDLVYGGRAYYAPTKMLFQNITRARKRLNLVIINNREVLNRCMEILK